MMATQHTNHPLPPPPGGVSYQPPAQQQQHYPQQQYQPQQYQQQQQQYPPQQVQQQQQQQRFSVQSPPNFQQQQPLPYQQQQQPLPPQHRHQQAQAPQRPPLESRKSRPKSSFSFRSDRSNKGAAPHPKAELIETHAEKESRRLHSKADPTLAMIEAEPAAVAAGVKSSLASLRDVVSKDAAGNPIAEPDRSNPTRSRWERPLDTIRSFEAAIDGGYNNRASIIRNDSDRSLAINRRNSYYDHSRGPQSGYYGGRPNSLMPPINNYSDTRQGIHARDSYYDKQQFGNGQRQRVPRGMSEPHFNGAYQSDHNVYPNPSNHRSYETVASGSGSGTSGDQVGYQTDPTSSDNSSIERVQMATKRQPEPSNDYGIGFNQPSGYQQPQFSVNLNSKAPMPPAHSYPGVAPLPPSVPRKDNILMRKPSSSQVDQQRPGAGDKRKSWFSRRFSKQG